MKRLLRSVFVIATIAIAASIAATSWAEQSTQSKRAVADAHTPPKLNPQIRPLPAGPVGTKHPRALKADLQVGVMKVTPQNPREGQQVTFEGNVMNYGVGAAHQPEVTLTVTGPAGVSPVSAAHVARMAARYQPERSEPLSSAHRVIEARSSAACSARPSCR